ncbi:MAG: hypothetical protein KA712_16105 [Myxococcales bacterium]|nr:hypothetical protein [Myxococcales bacterium]
MGTTIPLEAGPIIQPGLDELCVAPAIGVLAALDATLAAAAQQLHAAHPDLTLGGLAFGEPLSPQARSAYLLVFRCVDLRTAIREYRHVAIDNACDQLDLPF